MAEQIITKEYLNEVFEYKDGHLYWKKPGGKRYINKLAGAVVKNKYIQIQHNGKRMLAHRLIYMMFHGYLPEFVDHINGNGFDNRIENLREVTHSQNLMNSKLRDTNKTGVKGVHWHKKSQKWYAVITTNKKQKHLGQFDTIEEAEKVVKCARNDLHGEFARHH